MALVVARRSLPGLDIAVSQTGFPTHGRPQGPHPYPTPLPPLRETRRLTIFSFLLLLFDENPATPDAQELTILPLRALSLYSRSTGHQEAREASERATVGR